MRRVAGRAIGPSAVVALLALAGCATTNEGLSVVEITPVSVDTPQLGRVDSLGACASIVPSAVSQSFMPHVNGVMVGFNNYFSDTPCGPMGVARHRGLVRFDLMPYDSVVSAVLVFDVAQSMERDGGNVLGQTPPVSYATRLAIALQPYDTEDIDYDIVLPKTRRLDVDVTDRVRNWVEAEKPNLGFVLMDDSPRLSGASELPKNNAGRLTWYDNFRLRLVYDASANPRAPK